MFKRNNYKSTIILLMIYIVIYMCYMNTNKDLIVLKNFRISYEDAKTSVNLKMESKDVSETVHQYPFNLLTEHTDKCMENGKLSDIEVAILIKSGVKNIKIRNTIRETWGNDDRLAKFKMRKIFMLGIDYKKPNSSHDLLKENAEFNDMLIGDFYDTYYYNLSIKAIMGIKWAITHCSQAKFYLYLDDNVYLSLEHLVEYLSMKENLYPELNYPQQYLGNNVVHKAPLYGGVLYEKVKPPRNASDSINGRFAISFEEHPQEFWPPFVVGFVVLFNKAALDLIYDASYVTKIYKYDDIYLALNLLWMGVRPFDIQEIKETVSLRKQKRVNYCLAYHPAPVELIKNSFYAENPLLKKH